MHLATLQRLPAVATVSLMLAAPGLSEAYFVRSSATPGGDGLTWSTAFDHLEDAIHAATSASDIILIAEGTYAPDPSLGMFYGTGTNAVDATFLLSKGVAIYGDSSVSPAVASTPMLPTAASRTRSSPVFRTRG